MKTAVIHARIEPQTKLQAEGVLHSLGITPTEAIRIFYRQISLRGGASICGRNTKPMHSKDPRKKPKE